MEAPHAAGLLMAIGDDNRDALASGILKTIDATLPVSQCTVFAYEFDGRPWTVSAADYRGGRFLRDIADSYSKHFYRLDGNRAVVGATREAEIGKTVLVHQQSSEEISNDAYRAACYVRPRVSDRLSLLVQPLDQVWLSINLYRDCTRGVFTPGEIERIEGIAHVLAHAAKCHYLLNDRRDQDPAAGMLARIRQVCPNLSPRELDVIRGIVQGDTAAEIAERMGIKATSVVTYQKRAYTRLGISSQRQLFALCVGFV
jgi:DNA-binding CsgD family transcriptional regulator